MQWRGSVVKLGGSGHSVRSSHQTVSDASKNQSYHFTFHFWLGPFILDVKLAVYPTTVLNERMW